MYALQGWKDGHRETVWLETWDEVLAAMQCLEEDMYDAVCCTNVESRKAVFEYRKGD